MKCQRTENHQLTFCVTLIVTVLSSCATVKTHKPPFEWNDTFATAGTSLMLEEKARMSGPQGMGTLIRYEPKSTGFSSDEAVSLWRKVGTEYEKLPAALNDSGVVLIGGFDVFMVGNFHSGEALDLALVSKTGKRAQAKVIPFPIQAQGADGCSASAELLTKTAHLFLITVKGFESGEDVQVTSEYKDEKLTNTHTASEVGELKFPVLYGKGDRGKARFTAVGKECTVTLEYNVGKDALEVQ